MSSSSPSRAGVDAWGIQLDWIDANDRPARVPESTLTAMRDLIGTPPDDLERTAPIVTRPGRDPGVGALRVTTEDGRTLTVPGPLPMEFPLGYHRATTADGTERALIVSPGKCWLPRHRSWGWTAQLYGLHSRHSWGIGDLGDLRAVRRWSQELGAGFMLINPLHAVAPTLSQEASPYLPATRRFRNPIYLRVDEVPGSERVDLSPWRAVATPAQPDALVDRDVVWPAKRDALAAIHAAGPPPVAYGSWRDRQDPSLRTFAVWSMITELHGPDWRGWPVELRDPAAPAVAALAAAQPDRVDFYTWLQWLITTQLHDAAGEMMIMQDLPVGVHGGGFDAWEGQGTVAVGASVGAPPDLFNAAGQDWGSPPLVPWRLRDADYAPFIAAIRATIGAGGGLRIDHVMGLFRLWWIPQGAAPTEGAYVRYPSEDLLDIVALESHRATALVVGEDLGTVEDGVREQLADHGVLSYRVLWFEEHPPAQWPASAMAAVTTHDLPTVAGLWTGADVDEVAPLVTVPRHQLAADRERLLDAWVPQTSLRPNDSTADAVEAAHTLLASAPSTLLSATLEDAVGELRRPNVPAVVAARNWSIPLSVSVDDLPGHAGAAAVAKALRTAVD